ncbi:uncharacterized protein LOC112515604 [Cynara cardunculus var. scolymus]|uniref:uncharacterized protein LOC112515604 n=1 Tax=Cynara cardunculus var. scolymus TaxID=59895 RepID=UPI000D62A147|nr:uncharacterized protein LOC112515604 [Cynara cardunculus var. scolymus]
MYETCLSVNCTVKDLWDGVSWKWPLELLDRHGVVLGSYKPRLIANVADVVKWKDRQGRLKDFGADLAWNEIKQCRKVVGWADWVWFHQNTLRHAFILWLAIKERLRTREKLVSWNIGDASECVFCKKHLESHNHVFMDCDFSKDIWNSFLALVNLDGFFVDIVDKDDGWARFIKISSIPCKKSCWNLIKRWLFGAVVYFIWQERNYRIFQAKERKVDGICSLIKDYVRLKMLGADIKKGRMYAQALRKWGFKELDCEDGQKIE